ncbi:MAG TPA: homoserine dehydrogenase, partial [Anaerolineae bacterium]
MTQSSTDLKIQPLFLMGFGGVGRALARQILGARTLHARRNGLRLQIVGLADSAGVYVDPQGIPDVRLLELLELKTRTGKLGVAQIALSTAHLETLLPEKAIIADTSATDQTVPLLLEARQRRWGIVLANKLPLAGDITWFDGITAAPARWETTVGAALPVISTLNVLLDSGDEILRIEGSLSGTLGYIASQLEVGVRFGDAVRDAKQRGYTEPDPRQDLGGLDAARKALIMARMLGYRLEMRDVQVGSLYPAQMNGLSVDQFLHEVDTLNEPMRQKAAQLASGGKKLRYAAVVENGACRVELTGVDPLSKLGGIRTSDSIVVFTTRQYRENPLAISGRGA